MKALKIAAAAALLVTAGSAFAQIANTSHDLSGLNGTTDNEEICVYCHTPHSGTTGFAAPLWNKATSTATYSMYSSTSLVAQPGAIDDRSKACLSCHDGTLAYDAIVNAPGLSAAIGGSSTFSSTAYAFVGSDLSNDHPIAISYSTAAADPGINNSSSLITAQGDVMGCHTCHDVHNADGNSSFLRIDNGGSLLCLNCHNK